MPHALDAPAEVAANPAARIADLHAALDDPAIRGIVSTIGGDDSIRLLPYFDLEKIRASPKVFIGYSDSTVTHFAFRKAGVVSFYGPATMAGFGENAGLFPYMIDSVQRTLFSSEPIGVIAPHRQPWCVEPLNWEDPENQERPRKREAPLDWRWLQGRGAVEGHLLGGCVEVLEFLRGTTLWPSLDDWTGAILFLETSEECTSAQMLTRALRGYAAMGALERVSGILVGRPGGGLPIERFAEFDRALTHVVSEECGHKDLPIVSCMDFGHTDPMFVLPLGARARIDCERREFSILESAVR